jgi:hypothetical protein
MSPQALHQCFFIITMENLTPHWQFLTSFLSRSEMPDRIVLVLVSASRVGVITHESDANLVAIDYLLL